MKHKIREWLWRYGPAEIAGTVIAVLSAVIAFHVSRNPVVSAYAGTLGENIGYYGTIIVRDLLHHGNSVSKLAHIRNWSVEFGISELLDTALIRPFWMFFFPHVFGNFAVGILVGKLAADVTFYVPTIIAYEFRKKHWK